MKGYSEGEPPDDPGGFPPIRGKPSLQEFMKRKYFDRIIRQREMEETIREQGWTQERIGKALGVSKMTVSRWLPVTNVTNQNSDNSLTLTPTENPEQHGFSKGEDFEVFHEIVKNPQGGYSLDLRSKERQGGVLAADQRKTH